MSALREPIGALDQRAWTLRFTNRDDLRAVVDEILRLAPAGSLEEATGHYHRAVWAWQANDRDQSSAARALAAQLFERHRDVAGTANCRDLEALAERFMGNLDRAAQLYRINRELPDSARTLAEHYVSCSGEGAVFLATARHDDCQRVWSIALSLAQKTNNPGLEVSALCNLGAWNIAVCNFDDGRRLCQRAFDLAQTVLDLKRPAGFTAGWLNSGMNLVVAFDCLGRHDDARIMVQRIMDREGDFPPGQLANYYVTLASAVLHAGDIGRAEHFLRQSLEVGGAATDFAIEGSIVQAEIWNQRGEHAHTRELCARVIAEGQARKRDVSAHDLMRLYNAATLANEALGDFETALRHQKIAFEKYEELVGKSARARRLTLEIQTELERTEWQRDQALKLRRAAESEQARLAELNGALQAANAAKSGFLAAASHDLRQPVLAVSLLADTLGERLSDPRQRELVTRIRQSTEALRRLLGELLDISELDAGATQASIATFPIADLLLAIDDEFRDLALSRDLELRLRSVDTWVASDASHLLRIMRHLVTNALAFTERGGVLVAARVRGDTLWLEVWDTGIGIGDQHLPHLFEEFYQVGNRARDRRKGLGLGLAIVKRLAELLGHHLEVHSRPGRGTVVRLALPRRQPY